MELKRMLPQMTVLMREQATEVALKRVASPEILHIATHGYFLEEEVTADSAATGAT
jgi:CHAT domain-containing protein